MMQRRLEWLSLLAPNMAPVYEFVAEYVSRRVGCRATFERGTSYSKFDQGLLDVGFVCGLPYVEAANNSPVRVEPVVAPVLLGDRYQNRPIYFSDVIVAADSDISRWDDLRGRTWCFNEPRSHSGCNVVRHRLVEWGLGLDFFGSVTRAGWHQRCIEMVISRQADMAAIDSQVLAIELRDRPELRDQIRIIDVLGPSTIQPVVVGTHLGPDLRDKIKRAFLDMSSDTDARAALAHGFIVRWEAVQDSDYDDIRAMLAAVERDETTAPQSRATGPASR